MLVGLLEVDLAADRRHPDRVAVVADPAHGAVEQVARADRVELAEAEAVEDRDRAGADREDVAEDAADPGRRPLERFDRARVVVRLDLEGDRVAVADVDGAGVLARPHHHPLALGRQPPQQFARVLVGAVLGPEQAEHRQLDVVRLAAELLDDQPVLVVGQAELAVFGLLLHVVVLAALIAAKRSRARKTREPVGRAGQRVDRVLGVRHQPDHVAGFVADPGDVADRAVGVVPVGVAVGDLPPLLELVEHLLRRVVAPFPVLHRDRERRRADSAMSVARRPRAGRPGGR